VAAVELQRQVTVKIDTQGTVICFTSRLAHRAVTKEASTH
jgi:hypothetical protein